MAKWKHWPHGKGIKEFSRKNLFIVASNYGANTKNRIRAIIRGYVIYI